MENIDKLTHNLLKPNNFIVSFDYLPDVVYHCRQVPLPNMSISPISMGSGQKVRYNAPGTVMNFDPFTLIYAIDEDMNNYNAMLEWMLMLSEEDFDHEKHTKDASVILTTNNNNPNVEYIYESCWPMTVTEITFNVNDESPELIHTVVFSYDKLRVNKSGL